MNRFVTSESNTTSIQEELLLKIDYDELVNKSTIQDGKKLHFLSYSQVLLSKLFLELLFILQMDLELCLIKL